MGDSYGFDKVKRSVFLSGAHRFIENDEDNGLINGYNEDFRTIVCDLDREDFLCSLVRPPEGFADGDPELAAFLRGGFDAKNEQCFVVTRDSVQKALDVFVKLDERVSSMPFTRDGEAGRCLKSLFKNYPSDDMPKYMEDCPDNPLYCYYGDSRENVEIYKEVKKVYGDRAYHYSFPWEDRTLVCGPKGAANVISALEEVLHEMDAEDAADYVFLFTWT